MDGKKRVIIEIPKLPATFTGTGDLFAALILAWMNKTNGNLKLSLERTTATLQAVVKRTMEKAKSKLKLKKKYLVR